MYVNVCVCTRVCLCAYVTYTDIHYMHTRMRYTYRKISMHTIECIVIHSGRIVTIILIAKILRSILRKIFANSVRIRIYKGYTIYSILTIVSTNFVVDVCVCLCVRAFVCVIAISVEFLASQSIVY